MPAAATIGRHRAVQPAAPSTRPPLAPGSRDVFVHDEQP
jgi:hypothetical protein